MRGLRTGALRQRLVLQAPARSETEGGAAVVTWADVAQVWAEIEAISGREIALADAVRGRVTHEVRIRYRSGVRSDMRFAAAGGRVLEVISVQDAGERHRWLVCQCEERML